MFRSDTTFASDLTPLSLDWTTRELLAWIAEDDARCHDESLTPLLRALAGAGSPGTDSPALDPASPVALVRALASRARTDRVFARTPVRELRLSLETA
jgi:hypothetical protein